MFHHKFLKHIYLAQQVKDQGHESQNIAGVGLCTLVSADFFWFLSALSATLMSYNYTGQ